MALSSISHLLKRLLICFAVVTLCSCGMFGAAIPKPTARPVTTQDIVGHYTYSTKVLLNGQLTNQKVQLALQGDGTFTRIHPIQGTISGTWRLVGTTIELHYRLSTDEQTVFQGWYVTDTAEGGLTIVGGDEDEDPDDWHPMSKAEIEP